MLYTSELLHCTSKQLHKSDISDRNIQVIYDTRLFFHRSFYPRFFLFFRECVPFFTEFFIFLKKKTGIFIDFCFQLFGSGWMFEGFPPKRPRGLRLRWSAGDPATSRQRQLRGQRPPTGPGTNTGGTHRAGAWAMEFRVPRGVRMVFPWFSHGFPMVFPQIMTKIAG